jgi:cysteine desulfurase family protein
MRPMPEGSTPNISGRDAVIYLDNAATSWPKPEIVYQTMDSFLREKGGNPGRGSHSLAVAASTVIEETRARVARFIHAPEIERVIFTLNCTNSLNLGLKGLLKPGDHVITSRMEHNAVGRPLYKLEKQGVKVTRLSVAEDKGTVPAGDVEKAIIPETRLIVMIHASNVNGVIQPIAQFGQIARKHNLFFMVDAAQTAGNCPIDVEAGNIDLLAFSAHKGTLGPPGVGVLYISPRVELETLCEGGTGSSSELEEQPSVMPYKFEYGTVNSVGIAGLGAGLIYVLTEGPEKIMHHERMLTRSLIEGLSAIPRVTIYKASSEAEQAPVISFNIEGYEPGEIGAILDQAFDIKVRSGLHCAPEAHKTLGTFPKGTVRLSPGYFNTIEEIEQAIQAIKKIAGFNK